VIQTAVLTDGVVAGMRSFMTCVRGRVHGERGAIGVLRVKLEFGRGGAKHLMVKQMGERCSS